MENEANTGNTSQSPLSLKVESDYIDFGCLKPGEGENAALEVSGGPGEVLVSCDQLEVTPSEFSSEDTKLNVFIKPSPGGELVWNNIVIKGQDNEIEVLVTARWEGTTPELVMSKQPTTPTNVAIDTLYPISNPSFSNPVRPWVGRRCSRCHKNFAYDSNNHKWEECTCNWFQMLINIGMQIITELRLGIKELPSYMEELWNVVLGKEKW